MNNNPRILVFGSLNADLVQRVPRLPRIGETLTGEDLRIFSGGKGANQACAAARLGGRVTMAGKVGDDGFAPQLLTDLNAAGADTSLVEKSAQSTGTATILLLPNAANCIMLSPGANHDVPVDFAAHAISRFDPGDLLLCQLEVPLNSVAAAFRVANERGITTMLDPAPAVPLSAEILGNTNILTPNQVEAATLLGRPDEIESMDDAHSAALALQRLGPQTVVLKLGERGCAILDGKEFFTVAAHRVEAVDTTAAGDTFNGALAVALSERTPLRQAVAFATAAAAISVTKQGAMASMPSRREVDSFVRQLQK